MNPNALLCCKTGPSLASWGGPDFKGWRQRGPPALQLRDTTLGCRRQPGAACGPNRRATARVCATLHKANLPGRRAMGEEEGGASTGRLGRGWVRGREQTVGGAPGRACAGACRSKPRAEAWAVRRGLRPWGVARRRPLRRRLPGGGHVPGCVCGWAVGRGLASGGGAWGACAGGGRAVAGGAPGGREGTAAGAGRRRGSKPDRG